MPRSMTTRAPGGAFSASSMSGNVSGSLTLPANTLERRTNPLPSSTRPSVNSGQSLRFSFECPRRAFGWSAAPPSK